MKQSAESAASPWEVAPSQFETIRMMARTAFGLDLKPGKEALVSARLGKRARELGLDGIRTYLERIQADRTGVELIALIDALTTNYTSFQREPQHFDLLRTRVLEPAARDHGRVSIWSAGCATGEEPYTILVHAAEVLGEAGLDRLRLVASDISTRALESARRGIYTEDRVAPLPESWRRKYLQRGTGEQQGYVRVKESYRKRIDFQRRNLMESHPDLPPFHVIFCRNVMIYFDKPTQEALVGRFAEKLEPGGWLLIGHSEGLMGIRHGLEYVMPAVYRRPAGTGRAR
ncbi:MAG TPA: CheR family methyltransferase [Bryobacteraceae bacterium]|nr:hypothetical protein [Bryobacterales bacterium]HRJ21397.1 CheR family methyltransferase [Bryobacteraceae bacterium]